MLEKPVEVMHLGKREANCFAEYVTRLLLGARRYACESRSFCFLAAFISLKMHQAT